MNCLCPVGHASKVVVDQVTPTKRCSTWRSFLSTWSAWHEVSHPPVKMMAAKTGSESVVPCEERNRAKEHNRKGPSRMTIHIHKLTHTHTHMQIHTHKVIKTAYQWFSKRPFTYMIISVVFPLMQMEVTHWPMVLHPP